MSASKDDKQAQANDNLAKPINAKVENKDRLSILVVSGRSGSGKTSVLNILEDLGYYSIDNLPLSLVPKRRKNWSVIVGLNASRWVSIFVHHVRICPILLKLMMR